MVRLVLLGTALHSIFGQIAPKDWKLPQGANPEFANAAMGIGDPQDDNWHAIFGWRGRKTYEFFGLPTTTSKLILLLMVMDCLLYTSPSPRD